jgi:hypothetical protein
LDRLRQNGAGKIGKAIALSTARFSSSTSEQTRRRLNPPLSLQSMIFRTKVQHRLCA